MVAALGLKDFLKAPGTLFDVRSPGEYEHSHLGGALNLPLFSDQERAQLGTTYKQQGRTSAVELGLRLAGPRFGDLLCTARKKTCNNSVKIYCWRGGMRSNSLAWLLRTAGLEACTLKGGYKTYRRWALSFFETLRCPKLTVLSGMTGSGKTEILHELKSLGEQVIDLEGLAQHRGSSFGGLMMPQQPSNEHFENSLASVWSNLDLKQRIWIEDESRKIGRCALPSPLIAMMAQARVMVIEKPISERLDSLVETYGRAGPQELIQATQRLKKRLGGLRSKQAIDAICSGDLRKATAILLEYYDKAYRYSLSLKRSTPQYLHASKLAPRDWAKRLIEAT